MDQRFNLRVYAIIENENDEVLVSDERRNGVSFTKFPGGGLEWGEGIKDCIQREIKEELNLDCEVGELFYVTDFFQQSAFRKTDQLVSFYYRVSVDVKKVPATNHEVPLTEEGEKFRWIKKGELSEDQFTFPIDKIVAQKLCYSTTKM